MTTARGWLRLLAAAGIMVLDPAALPGAHALAAALRGPRLPVADVGPELWLDGRGLGPNDSVSGALLALFQGVSRALETTGGRRIQGQAVAQVLLCEDGARVALAQEAQEVADLLVGVSSTQRLTRPGHGSTGPAAVGCVVSTVAEVSAAVRYAEDLVVVDATHGAERSLGLLACATQQIDRCCAISGIRPRLGLVVPSRQYLEEHVLRKLNPPPEVLVLGPSPALWISALELKAGS